MILSVNVSPPLTVTGLLFVMSIKPIVNIKNINKVALPSVDMVVFVEVVVGKGGDVDELVVTDELTFW